jgi:hypothetical protein
MAWILNRSLLAALAVGMLSACGKPAGDTRLVPETREGMFYLDFAEAQQAARSEGKAILLDMWRPG